MIPWRSFMADEINRIPHLRKPDWLKIPIRRGNNLAFVEDLLKDSTLNTVCQEANCPNRMECYSHKTATFMILGSVCTRGCRFCNVDGGVPQCVDTEEPRKLAEAVQALGLQFAVVTSVTRDDLDDGGASHFARVIEEVHALEPSVGIEVLIPDFQGNKEALKIVVDACPEIVNHNVETVPFPVFPGSSRGGLQAVPQAPVPCEKNGLPDLYKVRAYAGTGRGQMRKSLLFWKTSESHR